MGNNQHLKRHSAPTSWQIKRKNITFVAKPNPGSHKLKYVVPVVVLLRDVLKYAETSKEVKLVLHNKEVLVNGKKVTDTRAPVGIFDVFEIKDTAEKYLVLFNELGRVKLVSKKDSMLYLKVSGKTVMPAGKFQVNFMNGFNIFVDAKTFKSLKVEDTVVYDFDKKKVAEVVSLKEGSFVYVFDGKFKGQFAQVKGFVKQNGVTKDLASVEVAGGTHNTAKEYCFVLGTKKEDLKAFM